MPARPPPPTEIRARRVRQALAPRMPGSSDHSPPSCRVSAVTILRPRLLGSADVSSARPTPSSAIISVRNEPSSDRSIATRLMRSSSRASRRVAPSMPTIKKMSIVTTKTWKPRATRVATARSNPDGAIPNHQAAGPDPSREKSDRENQEETSWPGHSVWRTRPPRPPSPTGNRAKARLGGNPVSCSPRQLIDARRLMTLSKPHRRKSDCVTRSDRYPILDRRSARRLGRTAVLSSETSKSGCEPSLARWIG